MITRTNNNEVMTKLRSFCNGRSGTYCQSLSDRIQTHAIYGIRKEDKDMVKLQLKKMGAKKFRVVTANAKYLVIICFDANNIK